MKRWALITGTRLIVAAGLLLISWLFLVVNPTQKAKQDIKDQVANSHLVLTATSQAVKLLSSAPDLTQVTFGQTGSMSGYGASIDKIADKLDKLSFESVYPKKIYGYSSNSIISDTSKEIASGPGLVYKTAASHINSATGLAVYQSNVAKDLSSLMEYSASADMANFQLGSSDANKRLQLAQAGIAKTKSNLDAWVGKYNDSLLQPVISQIIKLEAARADLAKTGQTEQWVKAVNDCQIFIAANRQQFWESNTKTISQDLSTDQVKLVRINNQWSLLATKYNIH